MLSILHTEASTGWGGQEIRIVQESVGLIKRGYRVSIAAPRESNIFKRAGKAGIRVIPADFQKKNPLSILQMVSLINREAVDIVNTHSSSDSWVSSIAAKFSRKKSRIIRTRHLSTPISKSYLSYLIYELLPDAVITTGEEIRQQMIHHNGFSASKIFSIPTGIDVKQFNPEIVSPSLKPDGFSAGMVGVLRSWKGHKFFLRAVPIILKEIPEALFYIVGDGPQYESIKKMIMNMSLKEKVFMLGHREDIPGILASLDVIVHPSYANEGVPQAILQAMAMKKPVIASDTGSIKEVVVDKENGFLIDPANPEQIAERVVRLYRKTDLRFEFGNRGRRLVEGNYSLEKMLDRIEALYRKLF